MPRPRSIHLISVLLVAAACGGSFTDKANKTLATSLAATNGARDSFLAWDKDHQLGLVDKATSKEEAVAALAVYREKRAPVLQAFTVAYSVIGAAAALIPLIERGEKKDFDLIPLLVDAASATSDIRAAIDTIRGEF